MFVGCFPPEQEIMDVHVCWLFPSRARDHGCTPRQCREQHSTQERHRLRTSQLQAGERHNETAQ